MYKNLSKIAFFVSISCVLQITESMIPHPIPGLRLGLSNVITLIVLVNMGFRSALEVSILRTILSSLVMGIFLSPGFILSFSAAIASTSAMGLVYGISHFQQKHFVGIVGISVIGAITHNAVQLSLAYLLFVKHSGIFILLPWLLLGAVFLGWFNGVLAGRVCINLNKIKNDESKLIKDQSDVKPSLSLPNNYLAPQNSFFYKLKVEIKIMIVLAFTFLVLYFSSLKAYACIFLLLFILAAFSRIPISVFYKGSLKYISLIVSAFFIPLIFDGGKNIIFSYYFVDISAEAVRSSVIYSSRILLLIFVNILLLKTSSAKDLINGFSVFLKPLKVFGVAEKRIAAILSFSLQVLPHLCDTAAKSVHTAGIKTLKDVRNIIPMLANIIVELYIEAEKEYISFENSLFANKAEPSIQEI